MEERFPLYRVLEPDGTLDEAARERLPAELRLSLYRQMVLARTFDRKAVNLQRTGRIGTYAPFEGQEAARWAAPPPSTRATGSFPPTATTPRQ